MKEMLMRKYGETEWMKERKREFEYSDQNPEGAVERGDLKKKLSKDDKCCT